MSPSRNRLVLLVVVGVTLPLLVFGALRWADLVAGLVSISKSVSSSTASATAPASGDASSGPQDIEPQPELELSEDERLAASVDMTKAFSGGIAFSELALQERVDAAAAPGQTEVAATIELESGSYDERQVFGLLAILGEQGGQASAATVVVWVPGSDGGRFAQYRWVKDQRRVERYQASVNAQQYVYFAPSGTGSRPSEAEGFEARLTGVVSDVDPTRLKALAESGQADWE